MPTHIALGRSVGLDEEHISGLSEPDLSTEVFSPIERVVVEYARRLTRLEPIDDGLYAELGRHFTLQEVMELCFTIGVASIINRFHATFHTPLDERTGAQFVDGSPLPLPDHPGNST